MTPLIMENMPSRLNITNVITLSIELFFYREVGIRRDLYRQHWLPAFPWWWTWPWCQAAREKRKSAEAVEAVRVRSEAVDATKLKGLEKEA